MAKITTSRSGALPSSVKLNQIWYLCGREIIKIKANFKNQSIHNGYNLHQESSNLKSSSVCVSIRELLVNYSKSALN